MSEYIIDGVKCTSSVFYTKTGETKPFDENTRLDVIESLVSRMSPEEIKRFPKAPANSVPDFQAIIENGKVTVKPLSKDGRAELCQPISELLKSN